MEYKLFLLQAFLNVAALLSQYNFIGKLTSLLSTFRAIFSQRISHTPCAIDLNLALALLLTPIFYFLLL